MQLSESKLEIGKHKERLFDVMSENDSADPTRSTILKIFTRLFYPILYRGRERDPVHRHRLFLLRQTRIAPYYTLQQCSTEGIDWLEGLNALFARAEIGVLQLSKVRKVTSRWPQAPEFCAINPLRGAS